MPGPRDTSRGPGVLIFAALLAYPASASGYSPPGKDAALDMVKEVVASAIRDGSKPRAWMNLSGRTQRMAVVKVTPRQLVVESGGMQCAVAWTRLTDRQLAGLGEVCVARDSARAISLADFCIAADLLGEADAALRTALRLDSGAAAAVGDRRKWMNQKRATVRKKQPAPAARHRANANGVGDKQLDGPAILRLLTDHTAAGRHRRLGPDYAYYKKKGNGRKGKTAPDEFPRIYMPPTKGGAGGRVYQIGGPWTASCMDYSSTQGQVLYVPTRGPGVDRVTILEMAHNCYNEAPTKPWWGGFRPDPAVADWQRAAGGGVGLPLCMGRGMAMWSNCGVLVTTTGLIATAGTCTAKGGNPLVRLPRSKVPTAISVTPRNEFALVTVVDVKAKKGQVAVLALEGSGAESGFAHEWKDRHPCLPNVAFLTRIKLLGYVDLPGISYPTGICAVGDTQTNRLNQPNGHGGGMLRQFDLAKAGDRNAFYQGNNARFSSSSGFAVVVSRHENKAAFMDLQPLYHKVREMFYTTPENYQKTRDSGPSPKQWPYPFSEDPSWKPVVVRTLKHPKPTAVLATLSGGKNARAFIASLGGTIGIYQVGGLATTEPASPQDVRCVGAVRVGRNPVCLAYEKHSRNSFIAVSRGDREIAWVRHSGNSAEVYRRLRDARLVDPVFAESADTHGTNTSIITVADFRGGQVINYRYADIVYATNGGARFKMGPTGEDQFECGGVLKVPGNAFCVSATNVN